MEQRMLECWNAGMLVLDRVKLITYNYPLKMDDYTKKDRQQLLKEIINQMDIGDQAHLMEELKNRGIEATQATISRDLQELGVAKVRIKSGVFKYEIIKKVPGIIILDKLKILFDNFVLDVKRTGNLILVKTSPGNAHGVGSHIDHLERPEILGTIAGDDTILVVVDTTENSQMVEKDFNLLLHKR